MTPGMNDWGEGCRSPERWIVSERKYLTTADGVWVLLENTKTHLCRRLLPRLSVPLPLIDVVAVGVGSSFTAPGGGIPSGFFDCCVGGRFIEFVLAVPGV